MTIRNTTATPTVPEGMWYDHLHLHCTPYNILSVTIGYEVLLQFSLAILVLIHLFVFTDVTAKFSESGKDILCDSLLS